MQSKPTIFHRLTSIPINIPLFSSVISVAITSIAEKLLLQIENVSFLTILLLAATSTILILMFVYTAYELFKQTKLVLDNTQSPIALFISIFGGSLLLGLTSMLLADSMLSILVSLSISIFAFLSLLVCTLYLPPSTQQQSPTVTYVEPRQPQSLAIPLSDIEYQSTLHPSEADAQYQIPTEKVQRSRQPINPDELPPLFINDPLYKLPQPKLCRFFSITRANDGISVYNEDACIISADETRIALSDGAGASSLPRPWAALLGYQWLKNPLCKKVIDAESLYRWLETPRQEWTRWIQQTWWHDVNERNRLVGDLLVSREDVENIITQGAFATFLGLEIDRSQGMWRSTAVGDTCIFLARQQSNTNARQITWSMPLRNAEDFNQTPPLLSSHMNGDINYLLPSIQCRQASYHQGDILLLATDALSQWILSERNTGGKEWQKLLLLPDQQHFAQFIENLRSQNLIEEDDTTLVIVPLM